MADINVKDQKLLPFRAMSMAQVNEGLITYSEDQTIVAGLTAIKDAKATAMAEWSTCVQCSGNGRIENNAKICPLCEGEGKTQDQYQPERGPVTGFNKVIVP